MIPYTPLFSDSALTIFSRPFSTPLTWSTPSMDLSTQIKLFLHTEQEIYKLYSKLLSSLLNRAIKICAPCAIVQARAKAAASFAEKAVRKHAVYGDEPVYTLTDLCGARIITDSAAEMHEIVAFIKSFFVITECENIGERYEDNAFGYLGIHFGVQVPEGDEVMTKIGMFKLTDKEKLWRAAVNKPTGKTPAGGRIAEIQVRTLLQHSWANNFHDRVYKTGVRLPVEYRREVSQVAAVLEGADSGISGLIEKIDAYNVDYGAYLTAQQMDAEIATLSELLTSNELPPPDKPALALRISRIAKAKGDWQTIADVLAPWCETDSTILRSIRLEYGHALCRLHSQNVKSAEFQHGHACIALATEGVPDSMPWSQRLVQSRSLGLLGWICELEGKAGSRNEARGFYYRAYLADPQSPYHLTTYLDAEARHLHSTEFARHMEPVIRQALARCMEHVRVGIELPFAWFAAAKLHLLRYHESLDELEKDINQATDLYLRGMHASQVLYLIQHEIDSLADLAAELSGGAISLREELLRAMENCRMLLLLGKARMAIAPSMKTEEIRECMGSVLANMQSTGAIPPATNGGSAAAHAVIISGTTHGDYSANMGKYKPLLAEALSRLEGTVVSGGTESGIPGLLGEIAQEMRGKGEKKFTLIGYITHNLPPDAPRDNRYDKIQVVTDADKFSIREILINWSDILHAGIHPSRIHLLGIGGGKIAMLEYEIALALGATVGIVVGSGRSADEILSATPWWQPGGLIALPQDGATIRAFLNTNAADLYDNRLEKAGRFIHGQYLSMAKPRDENLQKWENLREDFKRSNIHQAAFAFRALTLAGFDIVKKPSKDEVTVINLGDPSILSAEGLENLAKLEHGRWVVERLMQGWRYAPKDDKARRESHCLVGWEQLDPKMKPFDINAVKDYPVWLAEAGFEIIKRPGEKQV